MFVSDTQRAKVKPSQEDKYAPRRNRSFPLLVSRHLSRLAGCFGGITASRPGATLCLWPNGFFNRGYGDAETQVTGIADDGWVTNGSGGKKLVSCGITNLVFFHRQWER